MNIGTELKKEQAISSHLTQKENYTIINHEKNKNQ